MSERRGPADQTQQQTGWLQRPRRLRRLGARILRRFGRSRDGSAAIEFALIAVPFLALLFAVLETAIVMWSSQVLETAVANASRRIFTGEINAELAAVPAPQHPEEFRRRICSHVPGLFDCAGSLQIDVRSFPTFASPGVLPPLVKNGEINSGEFVYQPSTAGQIVIVRAAFPLKLYTSFLSGPGLSNLNGSRRVIAAVAAFRNEPF